MQYILWLAIEYFRWASEEYTVGKNYGMNQNFADINPERDFQPFNNEKKSRLQTKIS